MENTWEESGPGQNERIELSPLHSLLCSSQWDFALVRQEKCQVYHCVYKGNDATQTVLLNQDTIATRCLLDWACKIRKEMTDELS